MTQAAVHDSQVFDESLDQTTDVNGNKRAVYADSAYRSEAQEQRLVDADIESQVCEKGTRGKPLTEEQKQSNRTKSKVRARVEHVFGAQAAMGGHLVRTIGLQRANVKIGYWLTGKPRVLTDRVACVDYSVAKAGVLCAYRWEGENRLMDRNLFSC